MASQTPATTAVATSGVPQLNARTLRSNSVSEGLSRSMAALFEMLNTPGVVEPLARALNETFLTTNNPDPHVPDSLLVCVRDVCGEAQRDKLVLDALLKDVEDSTAPQTLFRTGTIGTRLLSALYRSEGADWLTQALKPLFAELAALDHAVEFDVARLPPDTPPDEVQRAAREFEGIARRFYSHLSMLTEDFPPSLRRVLVAVCEAAERKFPGRGGSIAGNGLVILRYIAPAVLAPLQFNVGMPELSPQATRVVVVLSKTTQVVANGMQVKSTDTALSPIAEFVQAQIGTCADFIHRITDASTSVPPPNAPPVFGPTPVISKELRTALKVLASEIDKNLANITEKAGDLKLVPVLQYIQKPGKMNPLGYTAVPPPPVPAEEKGSPVPGLKVQHATEMPDPLPPRPSNRAGRPRSTIAFMTLPRNLILGRSEHLQQKEHQLKEQQHLQEQQLPTSFQAAASSVLNNDPVGSASAAAHASLDRMLSQFRAAVLASTGEHFSRMAKEYEDTLTELEKEREQRRTAERLVEHLTAQVKQLQKQLAEAQANKPIAATSSSGTSSPITPFITHARGSVAYSPAADPSTAAAAAAAVGVPVLTVKKALPYAAIARQVTALLEGLMLLVPQISTLAQLMYMARVSRELRRLVATPTDEQFVFNTASITYNPDEGKDMHIASDDEKVRGLRALIPGCLAEARKWSKRIECDEDVLPMHYPLLTSRLQLLAELLKQVTNNLRAPVVA